MRNIKQNNYYFTNMLFFHKILNVSSQNFSFEVRITTHFARISFSACKQRILKWRHSRRLDKKRSGTTLVNGSNLLCNATASQQYYPNLRSLSINSISSKVRRKWIIKLYIAITMHNMCIQGQRYYESITCFLLILVYFSICLLISMYLSGACPVWPSCNWV